MHQRIQGRISMHQRIQGRIFDASTNTGANRKYHASVHRSVASMPHANLDIGLMTTQRYRRYEYSSEHCMYGVTARYLRGMIGNQTSESGCYLIPNCMYCGHVARAIAARASQQPTFSTSRRRQAASAAVRGPLPLCPPDRRRPYH